MKGRINILAGDFISELGEDFGRINMDPRVMLGAESELEWRDKYKLNQLRKRIGDVIPKEFTFGYVMSVVNITEILIKVSDASNAILMRVLNAILRKCLILVNYIVLYILDF